MKLVVAKGGSIIGPDNRIFKEGHEVKPGDLPKGAIEEHLKSGYLEPAIYMPSLAEVMAAGYPEESAKKILEREAQARPVPGTRETPAFGLNGDPVAKPSEPEAPTVKSPWTFDPDGIKGMKLEELNSLVLSKDSQLAPFETVEEAAAWLSQDYVAPEADKA